MWDSFATLARRSTDVVGYTDIMARVARYGYQVEQVLTALRTWVQYGAVSEVAAGRYQLTHSGTKLTRALRASWVHLTWQPTGLSPRKMYLLSLFDGSGMARVGILKILQHIGCPEMLQHTWTAEWDKALAEASIKVATAETGDSVPTVTHTAEDVWELANP